MSPPNTQLNTTWGGKNGFTAHEDEPVNLEIRTSALEGLSDNTKPLSIPNLRQASTSSWGLSAGPYLHLHWTPWAECRGTGPSPLTENPRVSPQAPQLGEVEERRESVATPALTSFSWGTVAKGHVKEAEESGSAALPLCSLHSPLPPHQALMSALLCPPWKPSATSHRSPPREVL